RSFKYREGKKFDWDVTTPASFRTKQQGGTGVFFDIGPHVIDYLMWLFGVPKVVSYADDALAGVEANVMMHLQFRTCSGSVQLSWDSPLKSELRVYGSRGQAVLRVDQLDKLAIDMGAGFEEVAADDSFAADLCQPCAGTLRPRLYTQSIYCQLIQ